MIMKKAKDEHAAAVQKLATQTGTASSNNVEFGTSTLQNVQVLKNIPVTITNADLANLEAN